MEMSKQYAAVADRTLRAAAEAASGTEALENAERLPAAR